MESLCQLSQPASKIRRPPTCPQHSHVWAFPVILFALFQEVGLIGGLVSASKQIFELTPISCVCSVIMHHESK